MSVRPSAVAVCAARTPPEGSTRLRMGPGRPWLVAPGRGASTTVRSAPSPSGKQHNSGSARADPGRAPGGTPAKGGNTRQNTSVGADMPSDVTLRTVHMPDTAWTARFVTCDPGAMSVTDPLLVVRRHVDLLRVRSAICRDAR